MKNQHLLSDKDLHLIKVTARTIIENYYDNPTEENLNEIILLDDLIIQSVSTRQQSDKLLLISILEILKVKAKGRNASADSSIQNTIIHLKNPMKVYLKDSTIQECLSKIQLYPLCCTMITRFFNAEMKAQSSAYDWKSILTKIGENGDKSMAICLESLNCLLPSFEIYSKDVSKSGIIKYICSVYLLQALGDLNNLYRALKVLKIVAVNDRTVLPNREKNLSTVIYTHPKYIPIVREISESCFDSEYCSKVVANIKDIDSMYLWSYNNAFCQLATQSTVDDLQRVLKEQGKHIPIDIEWKIYATLSNFGKSSNKIQIRQGLKIPENGENLKIYLKLMMNLIEKDPGFYKYLDLKAIELVYDRSKTTDPATDKLISELKNVDPSIKSKRVGHLKTSQIDQYEFDKNPEHLMELAMKIPCTREDLEFTENLLAQKQKHTDQFQQDTIRSIKEKALESLRQGVAQQKSIEFPQLVNNLKLDEVNPEIANKLLKIIELYLSINPGFNEKFNAKKILEIVDWLENNHGDVIIDWIAIGEVISFIFGPDEWKEHIKEIPQRNFWLLNAYDCEVSKNLIEKIKSVIPEKNKKNALIVGFIGKAADVELKRKLLADTAVVSQAVGQISNYKSSRSSVKTYHSKIDDTLTDSEQLSNYLKNVLNLSYFIYDWEKTPMKKQMQQNIIKPCLTSIYQSFHGTEQQFRFIENCLPYKLNTNELKDLNVARLLETHGKLTSYLYQSKYDGRIDFSKISNMSLETDPIKIEEILKFLEENEDLVQAQDLNSLLNKWLKNAEKENKYWVYFPHYMSIINHILRIASKSNNSDIQSRIAEILQKTISGTTNNKDITPEQLDELYETIYEIVRKLNEKKIKIDTSSLRAEVEKIMSNEWKAKIMAQIQQNSQIKMEPIKLEQEKVEVKVNQKGDKYESANAKNAAQQVSLNEKKEQKKEQKFAASVVSNSVAGSNLGTNKLTHQLSINLGRNNQKKQDDIEQGDTNTNEILKKQQVSNQTSEQKQLLDALKMLKKIIMKEESKDLFPKLVDIFMVSEFNRNRKFLLGKLLTEYYQIIEKDEKVIALLQLREKTNLSKDTCYQFLVKFEEVFIIGKRWKLLGFEFLDLAMERVKCESVNKQFCVENGCEIAEYNLIKTTDLSYFEQKKYHNTVMSIYGKIEAKGEGIFYLHLVGTSARLLDIKTYYISNRLHQKILKFMDKPDWGNDEMIVANLSYALSSLVYTQNQIAIEIVGKKQEFLKLMNSYRQFATSKSVVESGCSLLSNLCYSNQETMEILYNYGVTDLLLEFMSKNLAKPEVSTYKQIMRALGNVSVHKKSVEKLVDGHIAQMVCEMIEKFNILIYRDEEKLKVLKLSIDFIANISSQKYELEKIHKEGVTDLVITLLETTELSEDKVLMGCIDTIDGVCQNQTIENYVVMDKKLPYLLIDILKVKEDERLITKTVRLLTNMTLNENCIPYILQANLLSVLANIVLPVYKNEKLLLYVNKIIQRIYNRKPPLKLILKSGYLDCLMKIIEVSETIDDSYIDIMLHYSQYIPNYLNHRAFLNLVKLLTTKSNLNSIVDKSLQIFRIIFSSEERTEDDVLIEGSPQMYEKLLMNNQSHKVEIIYLLGLHCTKSRKFQAQLLLDHQNKKCNIVNYVHKISQEEGTMELGLSVMFAITNTSHLVAFSKDSLVKQDYGYKVLSKGCRCKLYRIDGSHKQAVIDINEQYMIRAYKHPMGEIKSKYVMSLRQIRDWQFQFNHLTDVWKNSVFVKQKGLFGEEAKIEHCVTLLGSRKWGEFTLLNLEFESRDQKAIFVQAISSLIIAFKIL